MLRPSPPAAISGVVWLDTNINGVQGPGEAPAGGAGLSGQSASCGGFPVVAGGNADADGHYTIVIPTAPNTQY